MTPSRQAREALGWTQAQLAHVLGVHTLTVSKWERDVLSPSLYQEALLHNFRYAAARHPGIGARVAGVMVERGAIRALYELLHASQADAAGI